MGTLFGFIYCAVKLFDLGFNKALLSFYSHYSTDRKLFFYFLKQQLLPNIIFYCISIAALLYIKLFFPTRIPPLSSFDFPLLIVAAGLVATESIKALLKRLLQLAHNFRSVALGEIGCIICYQVIIWSYYLAGNQLTHIFIFGTFLVVSLCETVGLFFLTYSCYKKLPTESAALPLPKTHIAKNRFFIFGHGMIKQFFSANMLVPLFAYSFGFECAALLKLASYMTHSITAIIEKIIDPSSAVLFANTKNESTLKTEEVFMFASRVAHHIIIGVFIFILINATKFFTFSDSTAQVVPYIVLYFLIQYGESFFLTIEKFYIAQSRPEFIFFSAIITGITGISLLFSMPSPLYTLIFILLSRIVAFFVLLVPLAYYWNIKPTVRLSARYLFGSFIMSCIFFFVF